MRTVQVANTSTTYKCGKVLSTISFDGEQITFEFAPGLADSMGHVLQGSAKEARKFERSSSVSILSQEVCSLKEKNAELVGEVVRLTNRHSRLVAQIRDLT